MYENLALVGATGAVGRIVLEQLIQRDFPYRSLKLLASQRSVGSEIQVAGKTLKVELLEPDAFKGVYDDAKYRKSQQYMKENIRFGWITGGASLAMILGFWFCRGFFLLDQWVRSLELPGVMPGLVYMTVLIGLAGLLSLPFRIYDTFVIEEKFGFNQTTMAVFLKDMAKVICRYHPVQLRTSY